MIPFRNLPLSGQSDDASTLIAPQALELGLLGPTLTPQGCHLRFRCSKVAGRFGRKDVRLGPRLFFRLGRGSDNSKSVQWYIRENCTGRF
jgi:hypothetical protein